MKEFRMVAATGMLGSGFQPESIDRAMEQEARMIGCDAGSTDAGPHALATGQPQFSSAAVRRDVEVLLTRAVAANIPLLIGSAGTGGGDENLKTLVSLVIDIARQHNLHFKLATIHSEQNRDFLIRELRQGRIHPLAPSGELTEMDINNSLHTVAMMGVEPFQEAYRSGAQVIIAGRSSDTSIYAALPMLEDFDPGPVWHAAKILECGAAAVTQRVAPDSMMGILHPDSFDIYPLRPDYRCSPQSVASHTLYENADPFNLVEPAGTLITSDARYEALDDRSVRVTGSRFVPADTYTVKLEGARHVGYSTIVGGAVRDPIILRQLDTFLAQIDESIHKRIASTLGERGTFTLVTRVYGQNGVMGDLEPRSYFEGHEAFILWDVLAESQDIAHSIASSLSHMAVHNPVPEWHGLISGLAFPFAPAEIDRGPVYEFHINHIIEPQTPLALFPIDYMEV